mmetsp:Transcript_38013/g.100556  ORF Transcript_38013/g.100556 Transcript_38013/m.100556 type:complete len:211 (+) Transcript_38013:273-905(+)
MHASAHLEGGEEPLDGVAGLGEQGQRHPQRGGADGVHGHGQVQGVEDEFHALAGHAWHGVGALLHGAAAVHHEADRPTGERSLVEGLRPLLSLGDLGELRGASEVPPDLVQRIRVPHDPHRVDDVERDGLTNLDIAPPHAPALEELHGGLGHPHRLHPGDPQDEGVEPGTVVARGHEGLFRLLDPEWRPLEGRQYPLIVIRGGQCVPNLD